MTRYPVTCLSLSSSGGLLVTGETAVMGVRALTNIWDTRYGGRGFSPYLLHTCYRSWTVVSSHQTHHARVQSLAISPDETLLVRTML